MTAYNWTKIWKAFYMAYFLAFFFGWKIVFIAITIILKRYAAQIFEAPNFKATGPAIATSTNQWKQTSFRNINFYKSFYIPLPTAVNDQNDQHQIYAKLHACRKFNPIHSTLESRLISQKVKLAQVPYFLYASPKTGF